MRIAVAQLPGAALVQWRETLALIESLIERAAGLRAELVVLPECAWPAYWLGSSRAYFAERQAGLPPPAFFIDRLKEAATRRRIAVCAGYIDELDSLGPEGQRLSNAACLIDDRGHVRGNYSKCFLWDFDRHWFEPGRCIKPIQTDLGSIGVMICADARLVEIAATLVHRGAGLIVQPTAWVEVGEPERFWNPQPDYLIRSRAREFGVPIASASKWGREGDTVFVGSSLICDSNGVVRAQCNPQETTVIAADVEWGPRRSPRMDDEQRARLLADTRPMPADANVSTLRVALAAPSARPSERSTRPAAEDAPPTLVIHDLGDDGDTPKQSAATLLDNTLHVSGPTHGIVSLNGIGIAAVGELDASSFAPLRALTLQGLHVAVVFGEGSDELALRTRASENRIFIVNAAAGRLVVFNPGGERIEPTASDAVLSVCQAADKQVAWQTDVICGRRPAAYEF